MSDQPRWYDNYGDRTNGSASSYEAAKRAAYGAGATSAKAKDAYDDDEDEKDSDEDEK